jgi:hypothetical protein
MELELKLKGSVELEWSWSGVGVGMELEILNFSETTNDRIFLLYKKYLSNSQV